MEFHALIGKIYDAARHKDGWPDALFSIAEKFQSTDAAVYIAMPGETRLSNVVSGRLNSDVHNEYFIKYADLDLQITRLLEMNHDIEITGSDLLGPTDERLCPVHNEYLIPNGISSQIVWKLSAATGEKYTFVLMRSKDKGEFDPETRRAMRLLAPHVKRSLEINSALSAQITRIRAMESALDVGVVEVGFDGSILQKNSAATKIFADSYTMVKMFSTLQTKGAEAGSPIALLYGKAIQNTPGEARVNDLYAGRSYLVNSCPASAYASAFEATKSRKIVIFTIRPIGDAAKVKASQLSRRFGLTRIESELAAFLASGGSPKEFAQMRGRSVHTVRNQLKSLLLKTGARRQSELVSLILNKPAK